MTQLRIPAVYMRGGTSKGLFFHAKDLPPAGPARDALLLRAIGSPDPYGKQIDGMGGATSSTSKVVILSKSSRPGCDVDYLFGQVAIDRALVDYSGNCGNLTSAVGPFALSEGLVQGPRDGVASVRIWQANLGKKIIAHVPMRAGAVVEEGDFSLDGVAFPAAEIRIEFLDPGEEGAMFPTGRPVDLLELEDGKEIEATLINAGNPTVFVEAAALGLTATERQEDINPNTELLNRLEALRARGAVAMGLAKSVEQASRSVLHVPKIAFVAPPRSYAASSGREIREGDIDLATRIISMGKLHHAMTGTGAVAIAVAAAIPGTVVQRNLRPGTRSDNVCFGHTAGTLRVGAEAVKEGAEWVVKKAVMSRSARRLMEGWVRIPALPST